MNVWQKKRLERFSYYCCKIIGKFPFNRDIGLVINSTWNYGREMVEEYSIVLQRKGEERRGVIV